MSESRDWKAQLEGVRLALLLLVRSPHFARRNPLIKAQIEALLLPREQKATETETVKETTNPRLTSAAASSTSTNTTIAKGLKDQKQRKESGEVRGIKAMTVKMAREGAGGEAERRVATM